VALIGLSLGAQRLGLLQLNDRREGRFTAESIAAGSTFFVSLPAGSEC